MVLVIDETRLSPNRNIGRPRPIDGIVIHWWGDPKNGPTFDGTVSHLCTPGPTGTSAHYVVSRGRIARLVPEKDIAWHAGNKAANQTKIGIELDPRCDDETYRTAAALIADIRARRGPLPLSPHRAWTATSCPGRYDLARLDALAGASPAPSPTLDYNARATAALGPEVIRRWQQIHGTPVDGVISSPDSALVRAIQRHQNTFYGAGLDVDGVLGPLTMAAVQRGLNKYGAGLDVDGVPGPATRAALAKAFKA